MNNLITVGDKTLTMEEACLVHYQYELLCTQEFLLENYELGEKEAYTLAADVRRMMDKRDITETEAIEEIVEEKNLERRSSA